MRLMFCLTITLFSSFNCISQCLLIIEKDTINIEKDSINNRFSLSRGKFINAEEPYYIKKNIKGNNLVELQWIKRSDSSLFQSCQFNSNTTLANGKGYEEYITGAYKKTFVINFFEGQLHGVKKLISVDTEHGFKMTEILHYWRGKRNGRYCLLANDALTQLCSYKNDKLEGEFELYYYGYNEIGDSEEIVIEANNLLTVLQYKNDMVVDGEYIYYDHLAKPAGKRVYKNGKYNIVEFK